MSVFYTLKSHGQCLQRVQPFQGTKIAITWLIVCSLYFHHVAIEILVYSYTMLHPCVPLLSIHCLNRVESLDVDL